MLQPATSLRKKLWHRCFPVDFVKFLKPTFCRTSANGYFCISIIQPTDLLLCADVKFAESS